MSDHIVSAFDNELMNLTSRISEMGGKVERMVGESVEALARMDIDAARRIIEQDRAIDTIQREVDEAAILTIAKRQPMAQDLRIIISCIRISNDLERVGDMAKNIARRVIDLDGQGTKTKLIHGIENLTNLGLAQLKDVLDAFAARDVDMANAVWLRDEQLDEFYTSVFRELLTYMMEDPRNITFCTHLLFCAKNIERIGDHATNIAETVVYLETGQTMTDPRKKVYEKMAPVMDGDA